MPNRQRRRDIVLLSSLSEAGVGVDTVDFCCCCWGFNVIIALIGIGHLAFDISHAIVNEIGA